MTFTTPSTAVSSGTLTVTQWNEQVRDNIIDINDRLNIIENAFISSAGTITSDYIVGTADLNKTYQVDPSGGTVTITIGTVNPTGSKVDFVQMGSGTVLFQNDGTANLNYTPSNQLRTQYSAATLLKTNTTDWLLFGDLA